MSLRHSLLPFAVAGLFFWAGAAAYAQPPAAPRQEKVYVPYKITRGDILSVSIAGEPAPFTVTGKRVEAVGTINLAYIGDVRLVGLTLKQAQDLIAKDYIEQRIFRNPTVTVIVETYAPRVVILSGKVNQPGRREIPPDTQMTILDVISAAGGLGETAKGTAVRVTRTMPDGSLKTFTLDVESALKGRAKPNSGDAAFVIEPDDVIYVPEKII